MSKINTLKILNFYNSNVITEACSGPGNRLIDNMSQVTIEDIKSPLDELVEANKKILEENGSSSYVESLIDLATETNTTSSNVENLIDLVPEVEPVINDLNPNSIFNLVSNIARRISNGEIELGENPNSLSLLRLLEQEAPNNPIINSTLKILNNSNFNDSIFFNDLWGHSWKDITLGQISNSLVRFSSTIPLDDPNLIIYQPRQIKLVSFGLVYRLMIKSYLKHIGEQANVNSQPLFLYNQKPRFNINNISWAIVSGLIIPISSIFIVNVSHSNLAKVFSVSTKPSKPSSRLCQPINYLVVESFIPFLFSKITKIIYKKKEETSNTEDNRGKRLFFLKPKAIKLLKWLIILTIGYLHYKYNILKDLDVFIATHALTIEIILMLISYINIIIALVYFTINIIFLYSKTPIDINISKIWMPIFKIQIQDLMLIKA